MRVDLMQPMTRRGLVAGALAMSMARRLPAQQAQAPDSLAGKGSVGTLGAPDLAGRPMAPTTAGDNDLAIQALEKRLRCSCGCGLDIYTCRTTDFTCTYSPQLHREVMRLWGEGQTADQIVAAFVQEYGEKALMAPPARGFNLAGYLVPGALVLMLGAVLTWVLARKRALVAPGPAAAPGVDASDAELAELDREIRETERR